MGVLRSLRVRPALSLATIDLGAESIPEPIVSEILADAVRRCVRRKVGGHLCGIAPVVHGAWVGRVIVLQGAGRTASQSDAVVRYVLPVKNGALLPIRNLLRHHKINQV